eukprot:Clim_evm28s99 gene=Clim_evmTU28s99
MYSSSEVWKQYIESVFGEKFEASKRFECKDEVELQFSHPWALFTYLWLDYRYRRELLRDTLAGAGLQLQIPFDDMAHWGAAPVTVELSFDTRFADRTTCGTVIIRILSGGLADDMNVEVRQSVTAEIALRPGIVPRDGVDEPLVRISDLRIDGSQRWALMDVFGEMDFSDIDFVLRWVGKGNGSRMQNGTWPTCYAVIGERELYGAAPSEMKAIMKRIFRFSPRPTSTQQQ